jgi:hypothetical protein
MPGIGDWYLAKNGFLSQQTHEPEDPNRPFNLWEPVDDERDFGAHGRFDARARRHSWETWLTEHRSIVGVAYALAGMALAAVVGRLTTR